MHVSLFRLCVTSHVANKGRDFLCLYHWMFNYTTNQRKRFHRIKLFIENLNSGLPNKECMHILNLKGFIFTYCGTCVLHLENVVTGFVKCQIHFSSKDANPAGTGNNECICGCDELDCMELWWGFWLRIVLSHSWFTKISNRKDLKRNLLITSRMNQRG